MRALAESDGVTITLEHISVTVYPKSEAALKVTQALLRVFGTLETLRTRSARPIPARETASKTLVSAAVWAVTWPTAGLPFLDDAHQPIGPAPVRVPDWASSLSAIDCGRIVAIHASLDLPSIMKLDAQGLTHAVSDRRVCEWFGIPLTVLGRTP